MKTSSLDRRVRKEAKLLLKQATALRKRPGPTSAKTELLVASSDTVAAALEKKDLAAVRAALPRLDAIVDDLGAGEGKSTIREYVESIGVAIAIALVLRAFVVEAFKIPSSSMIPTMEIGDHIFVNKFIYGVRIPWTRTKLFEVRPPKRGEVIVFMNPCIPDKDYIKRIVAVAGDTVEMRCSKLYINGKEVPSTLTEDASTCKYWDLVDENSDTWQDKKCSRYSENIDGTVHDTFYFADRPDKDKKRASGRASTEMGADPRDFPTMNDEGAIPNCNAMPEATDHPPLAGTIVQTVTPGMAKAACAPYMHYVVPAGYVFCMGDNRDNSNDSRAWGPVPIENIKGKALFIWWSSSEKSGGPRFKRMGRIVH